MSEERHRSYYPLDDAPNRDIDLEFLGVNELGAPEGLQPGMVSSASNCRFTFRAVEPRRGVAKLPWSNRVVAAEDVAQPFGDIHGVGRYSDPEGRIWLIIAADGAVYRCSQHNGAGEIGLPAGVTITGTVEFTQGPQGLVMFRGSDEPELIMPTFDAGFSLVTPVANDPSTSVENPTDGTDTIPPAARGEMIGNRLWIPVTGDLVLISDYLNVTRYSPVRSQGRINQGTNDALVRVVQFNDQTAIAFKSGSVYQLLNIYGDLAEMLLDTVTMEWGICGANTPVKVGSELWCLAARKGVMRLRQTETNRVQAVIDPASAPVQRTIDRINWGVAASTACAAVHGNKYYLAVPLDDATHCGPNIIPEQDYAYTPTVQVTVKPGRRYRFTKTANEDSLVNGAEVLFDSGDFVAAGMTVTVYGLVGFLPVTAQLCEVWEDVNNAVLVFDLLTGQWAGVDTGTAFGVKQWVIGDYDGVARLMFVGHDGFVNLTEELFYDESAIWSIGEDDLLLGLGATSANVDVPVVQGQTYRWVPDTDWMSLTNGTATYTTATDFVAQTNEVRLTNPDWATESSVDGSLKAHRYETLVEWIAMDWTSRAYGGQAIGRKKWQDMEAHIETWFPSFKITVLPEGVQGEYQVLPLVGDWESRSNLRYTKPWNAQPWQQGNINDDHATPFREDYSVVLADTVVASGEIQAGVTYYVEAADVTSPCTINYDGEDFYSGDTFVGVEGVTTYLVVTGTPKVYPPESYVLLGENGVDMDLHQEDIEELRIPPSARARGCRIRVQSNQGRVAVRGLAPSGTFSQRAKGART